MGCLSHISHPGWSCRAQAGYYGVSEAWPGASVKCGAFWLAKTCPFGQLDQVLGSVLLGVPHGAARPLTVLRKVSDESSLCCERHCKENAVSVILEA